MSIPAISGDLLLELLYRGEGVTVDYKAEQYVMRLADLPPDEPTSDSLTRKRRFEEKKSEFLKDILAMANAWRDGTAYILLGFKERGEGLTPEVMGLKPGTEHDDSVSQQFVESKVVRPIHFRYEVRVFQGKTIAILSIPVQTRPCYLGSAFGKVLADVVYLRRGSSTAIANPEEIARMGELRIAKPSAPSVEVAFADGGGTLLTAGRVEHRRKLSFGKAALPDFALESSGFLALRSMENRHYWRELAQVRINQALTLELKVRIGNVSPFSLTDLDLHISATQGDRELCLFSSLGRFPGKTNEPHFLGPDLEFSRPWDKERRSVASFPGEPGAQYEFKQLLPGASVLASKSFFVNPVESGPLVLKGTLYANELAKPLEFGSTLEIELRIVEKTLDDLR